RLLQVAELVQVEALLLQRPHEPLRAPVALGLADERRRVGEAPALDLVHEGVRRVLPQSCRRATPMATFGAIEPKLVIIPCRIGSSAAQRSPIFATCQPITSVV